MTTKILTGTYAATYTVAAPITTLSITASGTLEAGLKSAAAGTYTVVNRGLVSGYSYAVSLAGTGVITNFGTIQDTSSKSGTAALDLAQGGAVTNKAGATIYGYSTAVYAGAPTTLRNLGTIAGGTSGCVIGGGSLTNGAPSDTTATISAGYFAVADDSLAGTVTNYGTISSGFWGVTESGGIVINGSATDTTALIEGNEGVSFSNGYNYPGAAGTVRNFGTILGTNNAAAIQMNNGGTVTNGSATDTAAVLGGALVGIGITGAVGAVFNFATIGTALTGIGIILYGGGTATNGTASDKVALLQGSRFGFASGQVAATLVNFGTVAAVGASMPISGAYINAGGQVTNGSTADTTSLIEGPVGVYGKTDPVTVTNFATITGSAGDAVELTAGGLIKAEAGSVFVGTVAAGAATIDAVGGTTSMTAVASAGTLDGAGTITLAGGASAFTSGADVAVGELIVAGGSASFTDMAFGRTQLVQSGGASVSLAGTIALTGAVTVTAPNLIIGAANVTLTGGGSLNLTNLTTNVIRGATASATLTNGGDRITGAGQLGDGRMALINGAGGAIIGNQANALVIDAGASTVINAGVIENTGAGGTTIASLLENDGTLVAAGGTLTVNRAVSGAGTVKIAGGMAHFLAAFSQNVAFGASGVLELDHSRSYAGQVSGFSKSGTTSLDLSDIAFGGATKASYSGTTASGVLTVTDGTHTSKITLLGNYTTSDFTVASDGHGGTTVTDPAAPLVSAMAGLGAREGGGGASLAPIHRVQYAALARPA